LISVPFSGILLSFDFYFDFPLTGRAGGIVPEAPTMEGEAHPTCEPPENGTEPPPPPQFSLHRFVPLSLYSEFITPLRGLRVLCVRKKFFENNPETPMAEG